MIADINGNGPESSNYNCQSISPATTPTPTPQATSLPSSCLDSCCYYVCVESYNSFNECLINTIQINLDNNIVNNINTDEYELIITGNCIDNSGKPLRIFSSKDNCYGCDIIHEPDKICNKILSEQILIESEYIPLSLISNNISNKPCINKHSIEININE